MLEDGIIYGGSERGLTDGWGIASCLFSSFLFFWLSAVCVDVSDQLEWLG